MYGVVRVYRRRDQKFRINDPIFAMNNIVRSHRIDVMNQNNVMYFIAWYAEITAFISDDDMFSNASPCSRPVKLLVDPPIKPKSSDSYFPTHLEIVESILKGDEPRQFRICSSLRHKTQPPTREG